MIVKAPCSRMNVWPTIFRSLSISGLCLMGWAKCTVHTGPQTGTPSCMNDGKWVPRRLITTVWYVLFTHTWLQHGEHGQMRLRNKDVYLAWTWPRWPDAHRTLWTTQASCMSGAERDDFPCQLSGISAGTLTNARMGFPRCFGPSAPLPTDRTPSISPCAACLPGPLRSWVQDLRVQTDTHVRMRWETEASSVVRPVDKGCRLDTLDFGYKITFHLFSSF